MPKDAIEVDSGVKGNADGRWQDPEDALKHHPTGAHYGLGKSCILLAGEKVLCKTQP
jgi:hypothetical protein